ncbi:hypothetical protein LCGC14_0303420 [marine sediment metagenome]|uniref:tRNA intron endonuclease catalytic domain-containing protein n=1 Tax=marine sediment metagenome TaxID=412755 RepID=A0A0F9WBB8_9ZZZZ
MSRSHRRTHSGEITNVKTNEYAGRHSRVFQTTTPPRGRSPRYNTEELVKPQLHPEVEKSLANIGAEIRINQEVPYVIIYDSELRRELGTYGIIAEDIGAGRQRSRQFHLSKDPSAISMYDLLYAYQLGLIGGKGNNRSVNYDAILAWGVYNDPDFMEKLSVYLNLRSRGLIVMSGTRYGTDFTIYIESAEEFHSKDRNKSERLQSEVALIDVGSVGTNIELPEVIKGEHLARTIGKTYMIASVDSEKKTSEYTVRDRSGGAHIVKNVQFAKLRDRNGHLLEPSQNVTFRVLNMEELGIDSTVDISAQIAKRMDENTDMVPWELRPRFRD